MTSSISASAAEAGSEGNLPRAFGRYTLFDHIGRGGMADIYLATRRDSLGGSRHVVIKQILPQLSADPEFAGMLTAEAKLAANLNHANVVQVMDLGREAGRLFIAMEYVEGFDLNQLLRRLSKARVPLAGEFALFIVRETLRALDYAHRARNSDGRPLRLVHRDVSPSNVLVSFEGEVKLCDFGIARAGAAAGEAPAPGQEEAIASSRVAGKSAYMAPEHAAGGDIDSGADIFSAGILLWELVSGRRLYKGTEEEMLEMARAGEVPPVRDGRLPVQDQLQAVLDRALARDRGERYETAAEFLGDLEDYALAAGLMASQLRFASFLTDQFAADVLEGRRDRERMASFRVEEDAAGTAVRPIAEPEDADDPEDRAQTIPVAAGPDPVEGGEGEAVAVAESEGEAEAEAEGEAEGEAEAEAEAVTEAVVEAAHVDEGGALGTQTGFFLGIGIGVGLVAVAIIILMLL
ncbi:MAG: hypothetical protein DRJ42_18610 [Deltaproteobacteria bacterium]|nr:MAG: hypothetical protein DRJ42_18610 [Deltaproteobacteria bacterium]